MLYLAIILVIFIGAAYLAFKAVGHAIGFVLMLVVAGLVGLGANHLIPGHHLTGWMAPIMAGMIGSCLGVLLFGKHGPVIFRVAILPALGGSLLVSLGLMAAKHLL